MSVNDDACVHSINIVYMYLPKCIINNKLLYLSFAVNYCCFLISLLPFVINSSSYYDLMSTVK